LKELARSYLTISKDLTRVMNRIKALYRSWGIGCMGQQVYAPRHRAEWLNKIGEAGVRRRAESFYQQLDALRGLRQAVRKDTLPKLIVWEYSTTSLSPKDSSRCRLIFP